ncbi:MAG TPA: 3-methyl-2-oxobutanoate dehydrogenase subunit VorB [Bacillota bacterium]
MKGNEAIAEAAIRAGCRFFAGYPITPQNEIPEYMAKRLFEIGGSFIQAESEVSAINMVYGAAGTGTRSMTSSSSPGISLKQEGISYMAGAELPALVVNMVRAGPGLGGIQPAQGDYFQATKGGGHGDYRMVVFVPASVQEMIDLIRHEVFEIAERYRNPVMLLGDAILGQMMEPVTLPDPVDPKSLPQKTWATTGTGGTRKPNVINSLFLDPELCEKHNFRLQEKYRQMAEREVRVEELNMDDAEIVLTAYGTSARVAISAMKRARAEGLKVGMIRPITAWPFPGEPFRRAAERVRAFLDIEMSAGQMIEDVRLAVMDRAPIYFYNRMGGMVPTPKAVLEEIRKIDQMVKRDELGGRSGV